MSPGQGLHCRIEALWQRRGALNYLLWPLSAIVGLVVRYKANHYKKQPGNIWYSDRPVIVVGNLYVGGTGKTPVVMALVNSLRSQGWHPGVISRGYGVRINAAARVGDGHLSAAKYGDEPALIAAQTKAPIAVHPQRKRAALALLKAYPEVDVIISDDGLQHLALGRDIELVVQDERGIGNGWLLPAGPLREPASRLDTVDWIIHQHTWDTSQPQMGLSSASGPQHVVMRLQPISVRHLASAQVHSWSQWLSTYEHTPIAAVAAIGNPQRFFKMLRYYRLHLSETRALPDHTPLSSAVLQSIQSKVILITAKDAVKCPPELDERLFVVEAEPHFDHADWLLDINDRLHQIRSNK